MQTLISRIYDFINRKSLISDNATIILGLSGGPDSIFLLHLLADLRVSKNITIIAAHLNHEWRPEADADEKLCKDFCKQHNIPLISKKMSELNLTIKGNGSKEEIGRKARRFFFESLVKEYNAQAIALAHHADDQMETFFIRLIRGASLAGLAGMKPKDGLYIRPLLEVSKSEILEYLKQKSITYANDKSNESPDFLRNRIRNYVIPALAGCDQRFSNNFLSTHQQLQQTDAFLHALAQQTFESVYVQEKINIHSLLVLEPHVRTRVIILWLCAEKIPFTPSQAFFDEMIRFLKAGKAPEHTFYGTWKLCKKNNNAWFKRI